ncbi:MAG: transketolase [Anaerolineae bacterium]|nr:transketolase [Anaerolineae bacterium]
MSTAFRQLDQLCIDTIRALSIDGVLKANSGHPGLPLGAAPMAYALWDRFLKHSPANPAWPDRDRFVLSAGHGSMLLYSLLHLTGYDLPLEQIKQFRQWGSSTPGHPERGVTPGIETTTGPLGQGFGNAVGMAMAERFMAARFNRPGHAIVDHYTYTIAGDGCLMEGIASEAASLAGHLGLGKLICLYDCNHISLAATINLTFTEDVGKRFEAYGWHVLHVAHGNDPDAVADAIAAAKAVDDKPSLLVVRTNIGFASPKQDTFGVHGAPLNAEDVIQTKKNLNYPSLEPFFLPDDAVTHFRLAVERGKRWEAQWQECFKAYAETYPVLAAEWQRVIVGKLPDNWDADIPTFAPGAKPIATRAAGGKVLNAIAARVPELIGGSADLNPSTETALKGQGDYQSPTNQADDRQGAVGGEWGYGGRNLHFGVREHAMGAILNGLALHGGILPFGATFLMFADYMRPAIRLAALMELPVFYVFTHDSIGVGEDGPTHQPVEQVASLRVIPNLTVIRPADANETAQAWRFALSQRTGPVAFVLTRQALPVFAAGGDVSRGAYVLADASGTPDVILIASGSEVSLAMEARDRLATQGIGVRVVSMPSCELFDAQPHAYRDEVLPPTIKARVAIEAGVPLGWAQYVGDSGAVLSVGNRFGASAPARILFEKYGLTVDDVVARALALLRFPTPGGES